MKPFSDPIWDYRLQGMWIVYTGLYILVGRFTIDSVISSTMILIGGGLVTAVFGHILIEANHSRVRGTLLVALTAMLFLIKESADVYKDYLATIFAAIFALQFATLIWIDGVYPRRNILKYTFFVSMALVILASALLLLVTLGVKWTIAISGIGPGYYVFGPMGTGAFCGLGVGLIVGGRILPKRLPDFYQMQSKSTARIGFEIFLLGVFAGIVAFKFNDSRLNTVFGSPFLSSLAAFTYTIAIISIPMSVLFLIHRGKIKVHLDSREVYGLVLVASLLVALLTSGIIELFAVFAGNEQFEYWIRFWVAELPTALFFGIAVVLWLRLTRNLTRLMLAERLGPESGHQTDLD